MFADEARDRMRLEVAKTRSEFVAEPRKQQPDFVAEVTTQRQIESGMAITDFALSAHLGGDGPPRSLRQ